MNSTPTAKQDVHALAAAQTSQEPSQLQSQLQPRLQNPATGITLEDSRFVTRWLAADPARAAQLQAMDTVVLEHAAFVKLLEREMDDGSPAGRTGSQQDDSRYSLPRAMRRVRNLVIATLICRDLGGQADLAHVVDAMTAFADFAVATHVTALSAEMIALHGVPTGADSGLAQQLIVLGMGKLGGGELNVSSDIDLIFVYPEDGETVACKADQRVLSNHEFFIRLGKRLIADLDAIIEDGFVFRVDMALRPNGKSGPLAASLNMVEEYLVVQGREWERYAWVKARAITGSADDIATLDSIVRPFVYRRYLDYGAIDAMRNMHAQIRTEVRRQETRHPERCINVKLGRGGIREIEFLAQVFQLIRGGRDVALRSRSTREVLGVLAQENLLRAEVVDGLQAAYVFLRNLEHRLQYLDDAQTHTMPASAHDQAIVARMMGFDDTPALLAALQETQQFVAAQFDGIFSDRKDHHSVAGASGAEQEWATTLNDDDSLETMTAHLVTLQFDEPARAAQRLQSTWLSPRLQSMPEASRVRLTNLINAALPLVTRIANGHTVTLGRLLDFFEAIARRASYLALLTEYPDALERVIRMMHASGWAATYLTRHPLLLDELLDDETLRAPPDWPAFAQDCQRQLDEVPGDTERQMDILREQHHAQLLRLLAQDLEGELTLERLADHLSSLADVLVGATVRAVWATVRDRHCEAPQFAVIAYGKLGGKELGYASDLDVIFLYDDEHPDAQANYSRMAQRFITWMTSHTPAGVLFDVDIALRPDGASGLLVTSITSFEKYQTRSAWAWEHQALTRARFCAGDVLVGAQFEALRVDVLSLPRDREVVSNKLRADVLAMRKKLYAAFPNRSALFDLKQDPGGMIDIEFIVQYLVLRHASQYVELTGDIGNIALLKMCGALGLIDAQLAVHVADAYRLLRRLQHQSRLRGEERARVDKAKVSLQVAQVRKLFEDVFQPG
ncbi:MAG: bifunctional [glutamate--ammonia ligase]-adenylyl-L-tyrosine phosphorylase/[glutamate--ammonia-ligase] adenylyltransferase [Janthinobacterium lividum]